MARNKYPKITVSKLIDVSTKLFTEKGYEQNNLKIQHLKLLLDSADLLVLNNKLNNQLINFLHDLQS